MKRLLLIFIGVLIFSLAACKESGDYRILTTLEEGKIEIEYNGIVYTETDEDFNGDPPGKKVFHLDYGEVCDSVAYNAYIEGSNMYLKSQQPFWADCTAVNFVLTASTESTANN